MVIMDRFEKVLISFLLCCSLNLFFPSYASSLEENDGIVLHLKNGKTISFANYEETKDEFCGYRQIGEICINKADIEKAEGKKLLTKTQDEILKEGKIRKNKESQEKLQQNNKEEQCEKFQKAWQSAWDECKLLKCGEWGTCTSEMKYDCNTYAFSKTSALPNCAQ